MGSWAIHILGHGIHDNKDAPGDADAMLKKFIAEMKSAGHVIHSVHFTSGAGKKLEDGEWQQHA